MHIMKMKSPRGAGATALRALLLMLTLVAAIPAYAQSKIGVVDMEAVTQRSRKVQSNVKEAQGQIQPQQDKIDEKMREWGRLRQSLSSRRSVMKDAEIAAEEEKIRNLREEIDDLKYEIDKKINRLQDDVMRPEIERIMRIVEEIARREGYSIVLPVEQVLFHVDAVDITPLVIQAVDREGGAAAPAAGNAEKKDEAESGKPAEKPAAEKPASKGSK